MLGALPPLIPAIGLIALWMLWIPASGAYFPDAWYPSALGVVALLLVVVLAGSRALPSSRIARVALLSFAALVALNYLSILWAGSPGSALDAANKLLLYLAVGWVFSLLPWTPGWLAAAFGAWSLGVGAFCVAGLLQETGASNLNPFFEELRYSTPLHYPNATAALAVMGMWPALILSARREVPRWVRPGALALATFLAGFALLPQSRAALVGLVLTAPLALIAASDRLRLLSRMAVVGGGLAVVAPRTVAVDDAINAGRHVGPVFSHAAEGMLLVSIAALVVGIVFVLTDSRWSWEGIAVGRRRRAGRRGRIAFVVAAVLALGAGGIVAAPGVGHLARTVAHQGRTDASTGSTRLLSTTPEERFDYARVALRLFVQQPVLGVGAGNFGRRYDQLRRYEKHSLYPHDVALRALSETGILGFGLLVAVVVSLAFGLIRVRRRLPGLGGSCAVVALLVAAFFVVHDSIDWLDEFPVLAAPAFAFALAAISLRPGDAASGARTGRIAVWSRFQRHPRRVAKLLAAAGACVAVLVALVLPYLETRYVERATTTFRARPAAAYSDLRRATELNPLSADPLTTKGTISLMLGNYALARSSFEQSIGKEDGWYPRLQLALIDAHGGDFTAALRELDAARKLDADDPVLAAARESINERKRIQPLVFDRQLTGGCSPSCLRPKASRSNRP